MDVVVKGRRTGVPRRFREQAAEKLSRLHKLDPRLIRVDVELCHENNPRLSDSSQRVELTCHSRGPVIRAEAAAADALAALDAALDRLEARLRRLADRRRVHHGSRTPLSVASATAGFDGDTNDSDRLLGATTIPGAPDSGEAEEPGLGPLVVREKEHEAVPMTLDRALFEMELVGHDFFLFVDSANGAPSVVYRRRGYDYGVIRLVMR
jgi:ribosomal subunit interface protein